MDGNAPGIGEFAMQKGQAVAHWHFSTAQMQAPPRTPGFADAPNIVTVPGGVPVFSADGSQFVGAVGVSGEAPQTMPLAPKPALRPLVWRRTKGST
jgi:uncharacterized protein GlcG (DUF336 family)